MNMFLDSVPSSLLIGGTEYKIHTDYRVWIKYQLLLFDFEGEAEDLFKKILELVFVDKKPPRKDYEEATEKITWFYRCGKTLPKGMGKHREIFSYEHDDGYIAAAFRQQYQIDLDAVNLHWWKFYAYFLSMQDNTEIVKIMGYRSVEINSKMPATQRNFYERMKKQYKLPLKKSVEEHCTRIEDALLNGESVADLL